MSFRHLVDSPRAIEGGVLFEIDNHDLQRTVFVTGNALALLGAKNSDRDRLKTVMTHTVRLIPLALEKAITRKMPELVVLDAADIETAKLI